MTMQISSGGLHTHALPLFALIVVSVLAVFWPTTRSMAEIWQQSSTYSHGYFVIPVAMWMASRESTMHGSIPVRPFWPGLAIIAAAGLVWLLGQLASVAVLAQFAAIGMVIATVLTVCGWRLARRLSFPLAFLFFAVPFGEGVLPLLMDWTADVTVWALRVTGMPVYREGNEFVIPSGRWSVIEACAGVRFLIAALMTGCIFAWHQYRTLAKRVVFLAAALGVALLANWLRAYVIVLMAHFSDNRFGASNHNTWGWLIFGIAMFALFAIGLRWSEPPTQTRIPTTRVAPAAVESWYLVLAAMVISLSTAAAWPAAAAVIEARVDARPVNIDSIGARGGWQEAANVTDGWMPELQRPSAVRVQTFRHGEDLVHVFIGVYRNQRQDAELVNTMNQVVSNSSKRWRLIERGTQSVQLTDGKTGVRTAIVRDASGQNLIWHWYWSDGYSTGSDARVKAELALQKLRGTSDTAAWVAIYTAVGDDVGTGSRTLTAFAEAMAGAIDAALQTTANR